MKAFVNGLKKVTGVLAKIAEIICMITIFAIVLMIVAELANRNFLGKSFRPTIEVCGILFLWMAFIGIIPLYQENGLMKLDFVSAKAKGVFAEVIFFLNKAASLLLGVIMVCAFFWQYPFFSTRSYATFSFKLPYTIQYIPMMVAGCFMALKTVEQILEHIFCPAKKAGEDA